MMDRNCGNCIHSHSYSIWSNGKIKPVTRCCGCSKKMPDGSLLMIDKIVNWTDKPCENYKPWAIVADTDDGEESDD